MHLLSVLAGASALFWPAYLYYKESDWRHLFLSGLPAVLLVFDGWMWIRPIEFSGMDQAILASVHVYVLGLVIWVVRYMRSNVNAARQHERELEKARFDSEAMRRLKRAFLANMNHEIRTPLTSIIGFSSLLMAEAAPEHRNMMRVIERSGQRLLDTLDSFLDLAMLESGRVQLNRELVDVAEEARFHASRFGAMARGKGLDIGVQASCEPVHADVDRSCLNRIFARLLSNAIKFTEEGSVTIEVGRHANRCRVAVRDTGLGIDDEYLPYLFDEFTQASTGAGRAFEGSGLGLAVTKQLVDLLDGTIDVETTPFEGSTFVITLPSYAVGGDGADPSGAAKRLPQVYER